MSCPRCGEDDSPLGQFLIDNITDRTQEKPDDYCLVCNWPDRPPCSLCAHNGGEECLMYGTEIYHDSLGCDAFQMDDRE